MAAEDTTERDENPAQSARALVRRARTAALATTLADEKQAVGAPYASLVTVAADFDGSPILLLSDLADHTRNLKADARASLLFDAASGLQNPQAGPRVTVLGRIRKQADARQAGRFLARHPAARAYASFGDFNSYVMEVERVHYVGGFARAHWIDGADFLADARAAREIGLAAEHIIAHMNEDHADALALYANALLGLRGKTWRAIGVDPDGLDMRLRHTFARIGFGALVRDAAACRAELVRLAQAARTGGGPG